MNKELILTVGLNGRYEQENKVERKSDELHLGRVLVLFTSRVFVICKDLKISKKKIQVVLAESRMFEWLGALGILGM